MAACVPVRDLKNTADFAALVEREGEVTVTKNGYDIMHCMSNEQYRLLQDEAAKAKLLMHLLSAERDIADGNYVDYADFSSSLREEYGL